MGVGLSLAEQGRRSKVEAAGNPLNLNEFS
jgi:hypothetical protein